MKIYAIQISYGDGCTYSAETLDFFHTDKDYLQDICDTFTILNDDKDQSFHVVTLNVISYNFDISYIEEFKSYWGLED